jgi:hypothetical protein
LSTIHRGRGGGCYKASQVVNVHVVAIIIIILWCRCCNNEAVDVSSVVAEADDVEADGAFETS